MSEWILILTVIIYGSGSSAHTKDILFTTEVTCNKARDKWIEESRKKNPFNSDRFQAICVQK